MSSFVFRIQLKNDDNGILLGEMLQQKKNPFLYLTANTEIHTLKDAVKTNPMTYISKPFKNTDVIAALEMTRLKLKQKPKIMLETPAKDIEIFTEDILYCEAKGSYTEIVTRNGIFTKRINLRDFLHQLDENFIRIHRSFAVNKNEITYRTANAIFIGKTELPVSKSHKDIV